MRTGVIGAGRVGAVLGAALRTAGYDVVAASGASGQARHRIRTMLPGTRHLPTDEVAAAGDLLVVAVPDDALGGVVSGLATMGVLRRGQVVAHTSGAHGLAVLGAAAAVGCRPLALHPAMTFTGTPADLARLAGISYGITAPEVSRETAARLVADLGGLAEWIAEDARPLYHAALAHGANHLVTLVNEAADRLREAGLRDPAGVLRPLLGAGLANALTLRDGALTGPVSRGDAGTIGCHLRALSGTPSLPAYVALARRTAERAIAAGRLGTADAAALLHVLALAEEASHR